MFSFFRKDKPDARDLEQVIFDVAEHQRDDDFHLLYRLMASRRVFVPFVASSFPSHARPGEKYVVTAGDSVQMRTVSGQGGTVLVAAATRDDAPLLKGGYGEMQWRDFLEMASKMDESCYGALLQCWTSWIGFDRERIKYILGLGT
jgi:hypothetical protein